MKALATAVELILNAALVATVVFYAWKVTGQLRRHSKEIADLQTDLDNLWRASAGACGDACSAIKSLREIGELREQIREARQKGKRNPYAS